MDKIFFGVLFALLACTTVNAEGLKCVQCMNCEDLSKIKIEDKSITCMLNNSVPVPNANLTNPEYSCFTATTKIYDGEGIVRGCTLAKNCTALLDTMGDKKNESTCHEICQKDNCNPASNVVSWTFTSIFIIAMFKLFL